MRLRQLFYISIITVLLPGCATVDPVNAFKLSATNLKERQMQSREYKGISEEKILSAAAALLQDMGYTISESETRLGVITAKKEADARDGAQIALAFFSALFGNSNATYDDKQLFTITLVILPRGNSDVFTVRMTMQRVVWTVQRTISHLGVVKSEEVYKNFFQQLSKAVFLEKNI